MEAWRLNVPAIDSSRTLFQWNGGMRVWSGRSVSFLAFRVSFTVNVTFSAWRIISRVIFGYAAMVS